MEGHRYFGHMAASTILQLNSSNPRLYLGITLVLDEKIKVVTCESFIFAKARAHSHKYISRKPDHVLQRIDLELGLSNGFKVSRDVMTTSLSSTSFRS
ncbi:BZ3500_MvSof-1268-A1-R1_Chr3-1g05687 [Microbotryum saponariae]|uniref:BZ3500_MvSof-1268-A1-R1_Chr3-1g05687 protein n=1 Tax=Microbotryum saponariae TaxID=289078 RepID=A0A2X0MWJ1_9BASI|nr:BZ3500_MvSof-1268-A1-R1_Chr3-1g05687 [Microbotryum saponariae]SDA04877.1 BZ3501_MvSof-1269-A2-R1_Chr3-1g05357 [Microbotryum saponariae]